TVVYTNGLGEFDQDKSSITAVPSEIQADGVSISVITVTLVHANTDQPLTGLSSDELTILTSDEKPMIGELGEMIEESAGIYTYTMTSTEVLGTDTLTFRTKAEQYTGTPATITYSAGDGNFDQESSTIVANPVEIDADGVMTSTVTVTMYYDAAGQKPIIGYTGLTLVDTDGTQLGDVSAVTEVGNGVYTFTVSSNKVGEDIFAFETRAKISDATAMITYSAGDG